MTPNDLVDSWMNDEHGAWHPISGPRSDRQVPATSFDVRKRALSPAPSCRTASTIASSGSRSTNSEHDSWGPGSSVSSDTSRHPPWFPPINGTQPTNVLPQTPFDYGYDLPCEQAFAGCNIRFSPGYFESWIDHSISHMAGRFPTRTVCTFCDKEFDCSINEELPMMNWRKRMLHIGRHFHEGRELNRERQMEHLRPDFHVVDFMMTTGLLSKEDYDNANRYTERPKCRGLSLHPLGYVPEEMRAREERQVRDERVTRANHDLAAEERLRKKEARDAKRTRDNRRRKP